ncbi:MAG: hypothetical protein ACHQRJ_24420 [Alphaproteobacteria bacterium]
MKTGKKGNDPENPPPGLVFVGIERIAHVSGAETEEIERPFADRSDFLYTGQLISNEKMAVYSLAVRPQTSIAIPLEAPSYARIGPAIALQLLQDLPDVRLVERLLIIDGRHREEPWIWQTTGQKHVVRAEALPWGEIRLYRPAADQELGDVMRHEWCHLLRFASAREASLFDGVGALEPLEADALLGGTAGAWTIPADEIWATFGEILLTAGAVMAMTAFAYPVRAALWGSALAARLASLPPAMRSGRHDSYAGSARWLVTTVRERALDELEKKAEACADANAGPGAAALLAELRREGA